jgi:hypothetical protein
VWVILIQFGPAEGRISAIYPRLRLSNISEKCFSDQYEDQMLALLAYFFI